MKIIFKTKKFGFSVGDHVRVGCYEGKRLAAKTLLYGNPHKISAGRILKIRAIQQSNHDFIGQWVSLENEVNNYIGMVSVYLIESCENKI